jgi:beta-glucanase (GH16 family)
MRIFLATIFAAALIASTILFDCQVSSAATDAWTQVWADEFNGSAVNTTNWRNLQWTEPYNNERQAYVPSQASVLGGMLTITATNQPFGGKQYRSARLESNYSNQYGRWEIRAKLPSTKGTWPAIWLLPNGAQYPWPSQGEIDILENRGQQPNLTSAAFHYGPNSNSHQYKYDENTTARFGQPVNYHDSFHTYTVEWDAQKIRYFIDDVNWYTLYDSEVNGTISQNAPMETVLNVAVGGDFLGGSDQQPDGSSIWPQTMQVDYVRVFERDNSVPIKFTNGDFEANDGSLAGWSTFGTEPYTNNVSVHNQAAFGEASLKLFGQFTGGTNYSGVSQGMSVAAGDEIRADVSRFIRSQDTITGTNNSVLLQIEFYNQFGAKADTSAMLDREILTIANGSSANNAWQDFSLTATAPANAVEARIALVFKQMNNGSGAVHLDNVKFLNLSTLAAADFNLDGIVDAADLAAWQNGYGMSTGATREDGDADDDGDVDGRDYLIWQQQISAPEPVSSLSLPEPSTSWAMAWVFLQSLVSRPCFKIR